MKKSNIIEEIKNRLGILEKSKEEQAEGKTKTKSKKVAKVDEDVCPICGGDLLFVEDGIVLCDKCDEYFELYIEEEKD